MDLQIMLTVANLIGMPMGIFRSRYYDNHHLKGGKFLPFIQRTGFPIFLISLVFVWLPYENREYLTKAVVVWFMYLLLNIFLSFYNESYTYFQQIITPRCSGKNKRDELKSIKETNLAIVRAAIIMDDLNKFSSVAGEARLEQAKKDFAKGKLYFYENAAEELKNAKSLPKNTKAEKEIRSDAIKNARIKKESASLIRKYGLENIKAPHESVKEELITKNSKKDTMNCNQCK